MTDTPAGAPITDKTVVSRNNSLFTGTVHDETVMMDIEGAHYYGLDDIGTVIWRRLETPQTFRALIDGLVADYDADRTIIAADVGKLLALMSQHKVVSLA